MTIYEYSGVFWKPETSFGVLAYNAASQFYIFGLMNESIGFPDPDLDFDEVSQYNTREIDYYEKFQNVRGQISGAICNWLPLYWGLGDVANVDQGTYQEHTLTTIGVSDALPSLCIHRQMGTTSISAGTTKAVDAMGCKVSNFTLTMKLGEPIKFDATFIGNKVQNGTVVTTAFADPTGAVRQPWRFKPLVLKWDGDTIATLISCILVHDNGLEPIQTQSGGLYAEFVDEADEVHTQATLGWVLEDHSLWDDFLAATAKTLTVTPLRDTHDKCAISLTSSKVKSVKITVPKGGRGKVGAVSVIKVKTVSAVAEDQIGSDAEYYGVY